MKEYNINVIKKKVNKMENNFNFKYWKNTKYTEPTKIMFDKPIKVLLKDINKFLQQYKPFPCSEVYLAERFEYADDDNWVDAIVESKTISPEFSHYYPNAIGIFKAGDTSYTIRTAWWHESNDKPFWNTAPVIGYSAKSYIAQNINEIEIEVQGVYVISWEDMKRIEQSITVNRATIEFPRKLRTEWENADGKHTSWVIEYVSPKSGLIQSAWYSCETEADIRLDKLKNNDYSGVN